MSSFLQAMSAKNNTALQLQTNWRHKRVCLMPQNLLHVQCYEALALLPLNDDDKVVVVVLLLFSSWACLSKWEIKRAPVTAKYHIWRHVEYIYCCPSIMSVLLIMGTFYCHNGHKYLMLYFFLLSFWERLASTFLGHFQASII